MRKTLVTVLAGVPLCAGLLCSCASTSSNDSPPHESAQNGETSQTVQESWGTKTIYKDASGYIVRIEKRGTNDEFLPGACTVQFTYENGERAAKQNLNSEGLLVSNDKGYAIAKYAYQMDPDARPVVEETFFDANNQRVVTKPGFAIMTCTENPDGRVNTAHFSNFLSKPTPSVWFGVSNVVDVQYFYLQGVTPLVCGVFRDVHGNIIDRKQLKGIASQVVVTVDPDDDDDIDDDIDVSVPDVHVHVDSGHHGHH